MLVGGHDLLEIVFIVIWAELKLQKRIRSPISIIKDFIFNEEEIPLL
jgi:hypothetical protein